MDTHLINNIPRGFQTNTDAWGRVIFKICVSPNNSEWENASCLICALVRMKMKQVWKLKSTKNRHQQQQQQHESLKLPIALKHIHTKQQENLF